MSEQREESNAIISERHAEEIRSRQRIREMSDIHRLSEEQLHAKKIISPKMSDRRFLHTFREIRTRIIQKAQGNNFSVLVTSVDENSGNSFVATNLAASIALDHGKTSLLVDCNLYNPNTSLMDIEGKLGFSDFLESPTVQAEDVIYATGIPRLRYVPVGSATDIGPEYYTSYRMAQFIQEIRERYSDRYVVLDASSVGTTADARIISEVCNYVVLVVPAGRVTVDQINFALESFPKEKILGVILNDF